MSSFEPNKEHLRHVLLFLFSQKKNANKSRRILVETYGENIPTKDACVRWFIRFKSGDFDLKDQKHPGQPKKFEVAEMQALLDKDDMQTQQQKVIFHYIIYFFVVFLSGKRPKKIS